MYRTLDDLKKEEKGNKKEQKDKKNPDTYAGGEKRYFSANIVIVGWLWNNQMISMSC